MTKLDAGLMISLPASDPGSAAVWDSKRINPRAPVLLVSDLEWIPFKRRQLYCRYKLSRPIRIVLATHIWVATHGLRNAVLDLEGNVVVSAGMLFRCNHSCHLKLVNDLLEVGFSSYPIKLFLLFLFVYL